MSPGDELGTCEVGCLTDDPCPRQATRIGRTAHYPHNESVACEHHAREHADDAVWDERPDNADDREDFADDWAREENERRERDWQERGW